MPATIYYDADVDAVVITIPEGGDRHTTNSVDAEPVAPAPLPVDVGAGAERRADRVERVVAHGVLSKRD